MKNNLFILLAILIGCVSCDKNPYHRDVSDIQVEFKTVPFHTEVQKVGMDNDEEGFLVLQEKYGD
ncbi:MAG: hypothetical protein J6X43_05840, partial [Bacteroidales bacterium]|nr:hypothetical protein [Bacteroidales bacterium]